MSVDWIDHFRTVGDVLNLIYNNADDKSDAELQQHAATLLAPRTRGSTTQLGLTALDPRIPLSPCPEAAAVHVAEGCVCFYVFAPQLEGRLGAIPLKDALARGLPIKLRDGAHGPELYVDRLEEEAPEEEDAVYIILGEHHGKPAVFTWHPGPPLGTLQNGLDEFTAVKTHKGE
jgi:hypothetical protein